MSYILIKDKNELGNNFKKHNMRITLIHPSRGRAEKAKKTLDYWLSKAQNPQNVEHILSIDANDTQAQSYIDQFKNTPNSCCIMAPNKNVVEATNVGAKEATGGILVYLSDDFKCPDNWDALLKNEFSLHSGPALVKVHDDLQPFKVRVLTIPIMNRELYNKLGYFWHPEYKSMFCDQDLFEVCHKNEWLFNAPALVFPHEHCSVGKADRDETYIRSEANWDQGKELFAKRQLEGFPV